MGATDTDPGATWNARVTVGARSIIALEASYVGAFNTLNGPGSKANVSSQGFDTDFRLNFTPRRWVVQPYAFTGVGYNHMSILNADNQPTTLTGDASQFMMPTGGGISTYIGHHATIDVRGTYRYIPSSNLAVMSESGNESIHNWSANAVVGYVF
jgi:hypothetical protein